MQNILYLEDDYQYSSYLVEKLKFDLPGRSPNLHVFSDMLELYENTKNEYDIAIIDFNLSNWSDSTLLLDKVKEMSKKTKIILYSSSYDSISRPNIENENIYFLPKTLDTFDRIKDIIDKIAFDKSDEPPKSELIQVRNDIKVINSNLIQSISQNPKLVYEINPRQFEELVAELFFREGYAVELTPSTNDGGKDIYAFKKDAFNHYLFAIECKRYSVNNKVDRPTIQRLSGVVDAEKLTGGILVTSSFFTSPAIKFSQQLSNRIFLNDYYNLIELINKHGLK